MKSRFGSKNENFIYWKNASSRPKKYFCLVTTQRYTKKSSSSWQESDLKNKSLKYEKSEKQTFEISIRVKKIQNHFLFKKCLLAPEEVIFLVATKRCANECSSSWSGSDLKNKSLYTKKSKTNVWSLDLGEKNKNSLKKRHAWSTVFKFFV